MSRSCLGPAEKEGELAIVIASNRVSGCGLEVRRGHMGFWDFQGVLGNKLPLTLLSAIQAGKG